MTDPTEKYYERYLTPKQYAALMHLSVGYVRNLLCKNLIPYTKPYGHVLISKEFAEEMLEKHVYKDRKQMKKKVTQEILEGSSDV